LERRRSLHCIAVCSHRAEVARNGCRGDAGTRRSRGRRYADAYIRVVQCGLDGRAVAERARNPNGIRADPVEGIAEHGFAHRATGDVVRGAGRGCEFREFPERPLAVADVARPSELIGEFARRLRERQPA
jgi:hypothetical protein